MKLTALPAFALACCAFLQSAVAYSPIASLDHCDVAGLSARGISITSWNSPVNTDPPLTWVQIAYDCSISPADDDVLMMLWIRTADGETVCAASAKHTKGDANELTLLFCVKEENLKRSRLEILLPNKLADVANSPYGSPPMAGAYLSLGRVIELARQTPANKAL